MKIKCASCGEEKEPSEKCSLKHPVCEDCFNDLFESEEDYYNYLNNSHI